MYNILYTFLIAYQHQLMPHCTLSLRSPLPRLCPDGLYSYPVDIWSCGCILAEMLGRNPLFPGKTFIHQLSLVFDVIGSPSAGDVQHIVNSEALAFLQTQKGKRKVAFSTVYPHAESSAWKLLDQMLAFRPDRRSDADEILQSPYLRGVGSPASLVFPETSSDFEFPFENPDITRYQLKQLLLAEIVSFRKERYPESSGTRGGSRVKPTTQEASVPRAASTSRRASAGASSSAVADNLAEEASRTERKDRVASASRRTSNAAAGGGAGRYEEEKAAPPEPARDENIPNYLKGTGNFRSRAASAPRARPNKNKASAPQRSEAKDLDDVSVNSGSVASRTRRASKGNTMVVPVGKGIAAAGEGSLVDGDETPRRSTEYQPGMVAARPLSASQRASQKALAAQALGEESMNTVRTSTMRNLLSMCDELYAEPGKREYSEAKNAASPRRAHNDSTAVRAESKDDFVRTAPVAEAGAGYGVRDSKSAWPEEAPARTGAGAVRSPLRAGKADAWVAPVEEKQSGTQRTGGWGGVVYSQPDHKQQVDYEERLAAPAAAVRASSAAEPKHRYNTDSLTASTNRLRLDEATAPGGSAHQFDSESADGSAPDSDSDVATPEPRSPPRRSIMQTYTSPTRLKASQPSGSPMQRAHGSISSPARQTHVGSSLAEKLVERARLLAAAVPNPPDAEPTTRSAADRAADRTTSNAHVSSRFTTREDSEADDDSSQGHYLGKVHPVPPAPAANSSSAQPRYESQRVDGIAGGAHREIHEDARSESRKPPDDVVPPHPTEKQRKFTVAKSPKFSLMSWQKRRDEQREAEERLAAQLLEESKKKTRDLGKTTKPAANGNYFGYQPPGAKRSDSAPRGRR
jgi:serine/threonine protein kinase